MMHVFVYNKQSSLQLGTGPGRGARPAQGMRCFNKLFCWNSGVTTIWFPVSQFCQEKKMLCFSPPSLKIKLLVQIHYGWTFSEDSGYFLKIIHSVL